MPTWNKQYIVGRVCEIIFLPCKVIVLQIVIVLIKSLIVDRGFDTNLYVTRSAWKCHWFVENCKEYGDIVQSLMVRRIRVLLISLHNLLRKIENGIQGRSVILAVEKNKMFKLFRRVGFFRRVVVISIKIWLQQRDSSIGLQILRWAGLVGIG